MVAWQPEQGALLAAPGPKGVVLYERDSWHPTATLAPEAEMQTLCFSPNGASNCFAWVAAWCTQPRCAAAQGILASDATRLQEELRSAASPSAACQRAHRGSTQGLGTPHVAAVLVQGQPHAHGSQGKVPLTAGRAGRFLAAAGEDQQLRVWAMGARDLVASRLLGPVPLSDLCWHGHAGLAAISEKGAAFLWAPAETLPAQPSAGDDGGIDIGAHAVVCSASTPSSWSHMTQASTAPATQVHAGSKVPANVARPCRAACMLDAALQQQ